MLPPSLAWSGALVASVLGSGPPPEGIEVRPGGRLSVEVRPIDSGAVSTHYAVVLPDQYDASKRWPVVVFLHGAGECGTDGRRQLDVGLVAAAEKDPASWPVVIVAPQKPDVNKPWEVYEDVVIGALNATLKEYSCDPKRVYLTGLSQGGNGTWTIAALHPDRFAAIAPICGFGGADAIAPKVVHIPSWTFHGDADSVVPLARGTAIVDAVRSRRASTDPEPKLTVYAGVDHNSWDRAYREEKLCEWMLGHQIEPR